MKRAAESSALAALLGAGLLQASCVLAAEPDRPGFNAKDLASALKAINAEGAQAHKDLIISAPDVAEDGAMVSIDVTSNIPNTQSLTVLVEKNPFPLAAQFEFFSGALPQITTRIRLGQSSSVQVIARAGGKLYVARTDIKVTVGGCAA